MRQLIVPGAGAVSPFCFFPQLHKKIIKIAFFWDMTSYNLMLQTNGVLPFSR
jgi:hypothetical protein